jgi:hypothetical protein
LGRGARVPIGQNAPSFPLSLSILQKSPPPVLAEPSEGRIMARAPSSVSFHAKGDESGERRVVGLTTTKRRIPLRDSAGLEPDFPLRLR